MQTDPHGSVLARGCGNACRRAFAAALASLVLAGLYAPAACASESRRDQDEARRALLAGEILSLREVLERVARDFPGEAVKIEFDRDDGIYVYNIRLLQASGAILKLRIDARSGEVLGLHGRDVERTRH